jgi:adenosylcobyric acid synthase
MGQRVGAYEIHHGITERGSQSVGWVHLDDVYGFEDDGAVDLEDASVLGTSLHGMFEEDAFRATFLTELGRRRDKTFVSAGVSFAAARESQFERLADLIEGHVDAGALDHLLAEGAPR